MATMYIWEASTDEGLLHFGKFFPQFFLEGRYIPKI